MTVIVKEIPTAERQEWDDLINHSPQRTVFLEYEYLHMWAETNPTFHLTRIGCYDDSSRKLVGGQAFLHKNYLGIRLSTILNLFYVSTPTLRDSAQEDEVRRLEILRALACYVKKRLPYMLVEVHPNLTDVRPYLYNGWRASCEYTHIWDLRNRNAPLENMHHRSRSHVQHAEKDLVFARESSADTLCEFVQLYRKTMMKFNWLPDATWEMNFRKYVSWMETRDMFRLYTCRTVNGELVGAILYILSRINRTVYVWLIGYNPETKIKGWSDTLNCHAAQELSSEFDFFDFGEGSRESIYRAKDTAGTTSVPFWVLKTAFSQRWLFIYDRLKLVRYAIARFPLFKQGHSTE